MLRRELYVYQYPEGGDGAGAGGAGAAAGAGAGGAASGAAGGGSAGGGTGAGAGAGAGTGGSMLSQAGGASAAGAAAAAAAAADPNAWLPEKYRVFDGEGDAKKLNVEASAKKVAEAHGALEKRMGETGAPPEKPEGYKNEAVIETLKKAANGAEVKLGDDFVKEFNGWAHGAKLTQAQRDAAMVAYLQGAQKAVEQQFDNQMASAQKELVKVWGADGVKPDSAQMKAAHRAFMTYAPPALRTAAEMDKIGNNPIVLQILAAVGGELKEDTRLHGEGGQGDDIQSLMSTEPYWNKKHPEHASTVKRVNEFFARGGKVARAA